MKLLEFGRRWKGLISTLVGHHECFRYKMGRRGLWPGVNWHLVRFVVAFRSLDFSTVPLWTSSALLKKKVHYMLLV